MTQTTIMQYSLNDSPMTTCTCSFLNFLRSKIIGELPKGDGVEKNLQFSANKSP